jgi:hypothetical protein
MPNWTGMALDKPVRFDAVQTGRDDVALLASPPARRASRRPRCISTATC